MRKDHSITGTTILQTTLEDAENTQFIDGKTNPVVKVVIGLKTFRCSTPSSISSHEGESRLPRKPRIVGHSSGTFFIATHTHTHTHCNRNPEARQKLCGAIGWYHAAVVKQLWRRRPIPETWVRSPVATHLMTSLNLPVSSLAPDSNWIPVTLTHLHTHTYTHTHTHTISVRQKS